MDIEQAAARLGIPTHELAEVYETPAGWVFVHVNGVRYIDCSRFDVHGRTGLMFLVPPHPHYKGVFPVFANPPGRHVAEPPGEAEPDVVPEVDGRREARRLARLEAEARAAEAAAAQAALDETRRARAAEVKARAASTPKKGR